MRTLVSILFFSCLIGCARTDARPANVERPPDLSGQPTPKADVGEQKKEEPKTVNIIATTKDN
jgi:hypothetical protein